VRRSHDRAHGKKALHRVSAWASEARLILTQVEVDEKSNEITALPELLRLLMLEGCIVTIDAMGTQRTIAAQSIEQHGEYALALKENQGSLHENSKRLLYWHTKMHLRGLSIKFMKPLMMRRIWAT